jgi:hypothetical protein
VTGSAVVARCWIVPVFMLSFVQRIFKSIALISKYQQGQDPCSTGISFIKGTNCLFPSGELIDVYFENYSKQFHKLCTNVHY